MKTVMYKNTNLYGKSGEFFLFLLVDLQPGQWVPNLVGLLFSAHRRAPRCYLDQSSICGSQWVRNDCGVMIYEYYEYYEYN